MPSLCPHCGKPTPVREWQCEHCGRSIERELSLGKPPTVGWDKPLAVAELLSFLVGAAFVWAIVGQADPDAGRYLFSSIAQGLGTLFGVLIAAATLSSQVLAQNYAFNPAQMLATDSQVRVLGCSYVLVISGALMMLFADPVSATTAGDDALVTGAAVWVLVQTLHLVLRFMRMMRPSRLLAEMLAQITPTQLVKAVQYDPTMQVWRDDSAGSDPLLPVANIIFRAIERGEVDQVESCVARTAWSLQYKLTEVSEVERSSVIAHFHYSIQNLPDPPNWRVRRALRCWFGRAVQIFREAHYKESLTMQELFSWVVGLCAGIPRKPEDGATVVDCEVVRCGAVFLALNREKFLEMVEGSAGWLDEVFHRTEPWSEPIYDRLHEAIHSLLPEDPTLEAAES